METSTNAAHINDEFLAGLSFPAEGNSEGRIHEPPEDTSQEDVMHQIEQLAADEVSAFSPLSPERGKTNQWDPRLILDLAFAIDPLEEVLPRYGLSTREFDRLSKVPAFRKELALTLRDIRENGLTFTKKAKVQAESYLEVLDEIVHDNETPASVRLEAIRSTVKWGNLEPRDDKKDDTNATTVNVQINF